VARVTLLLGSGASLSAGMASTEEITQLVLSGQGVWRHTDERYYISETLPGYLPHPENVPLIVTFLSSLREIAVEYYGRPSGYQPSYEDLFYLARQVADCETQEYDNPAVLPLCQRLHFEYDKTLRAADALEPSYWDLARLADEACNYIADLASHRLTVPPTTTEYLTPLLNAFCERTCNKLVIATLNHDTVIETALQVIRVRYDDGFVDLDRTIARWEPVQLATGASLRLFKLHGSVDRHWVGRRGRGTENDFVARIAREADYRKLRLPDATELMVHSNRPLFLIGTHNKILRYSDEVFLSLFYRFSEALRDNTTLVVCGYGFRDKGINKVVVEWLQSGADRRLVIIHPEPERLRLRARGAIALRWDSWLERNQLELFSRTLEGVTRSDLEDIFTPSR